MTTGFSDQVGWTSAGEAEHGMNTPVTGLSFEGLSALAAGKPDRGMEKMAVEPVRRNGVKRLLAEPQRPESVRKLSYAHWLVVGTVCIGAFMGQLDASIVTQAFPILQRDFHTSVSAVQWVGLSYLLVLISLLAAVGRIADMIGRKLLYTYGFLIFILGSALSGFAPSLSFLVAARILQGIGAAMLQANSVAIIVAATPKNKLGTAIGIQGAAQALGLAIGPAVGGLLMAIGGWQLIFFVNVPAGLIGTLLGWFLIPRSQHLSERASFDWAGLAMFVPSVTALLLGISEGNHLGWLSPEILGFFAFFVVGGTFFILRQHKIPNPMIDLELFKRAAFTIGIATGLICYLVLFGVLFVVPFFLVNSLHVPVGRSGLELMAMPAGLGVVAPIAGRIADRVGARTLTVIGMLITAAMLTVLVFSHANVLLFLAELALVGAGLGMFTAPNNASVMGASPTQKSGLASGVLNMARGMGTSLGLALTGLVFDAVVGSGIHVSATVARGFNASVIFLAIVAAIGAVLTAFRGNTPLNQDPVLSAE